MTLNGFENAIKELGMKEAVLRKKIKELFLKKYNREDIEFINMHGSVYMLTGLPDFMILLEGGNWWLELKRDKNDAPSIIQSYWIKNLRRFGFTTGVVYWEDGIIFKYNFNDKTTYRLEELIGKE